MAELNDVQLDTKDELRGLLRDQEYRPLAAQSDRIQKRVQKLNLPPVPVKKPLAQDLPFAPLPKPDLGEPIDKIN